MEKKPWIKNAANFIVVNSIFAALSGVLFALVLQTDKSPVIPAVLFAISFWLFALTAEEITTSVDEDDVKKYVFLTLLYNMGVIILLIGVAFLICNKYATTYAWVVVVGITTLMIIRKPWVSDLCFVVWRSNTEDFKIYLDELEGLKKPEKNPGYLTKMLYRFKGISYEEKKTLPHLGVYTRLAQSSVHGIGVVAICDIPIGTNIFGDDGTTMIWFNESEVDNVNEEIKKLYEDFCVLKNGQYGCPSNFNRLTVGWYLNHSDKNPNVVCNEDYDFISKREIKKGEELFVDYSTYSDRK